MRAITSGAAVSTRGNRVACQRAGVTISGDSLDNAAFAEVAAACRRL